MYPNNGTILLAIFFFLSPKKSSPCWWYRKIKKKAPVERPVRDAESKARVTPKDKIKGFFLCFCLSPFCLSFFFYKILSFYFDLSLSHSLVCPANFYSKFRQKYRIFVDFLFQFSAAFIYLLLSFFFTSAAFYHIFPVYFFAPFFRMEDQERPFTAFYFFLLFFPYFWLFLLFAIFLSSLKVFFPCVCMCELSVCVLMCMSPWINR